MGEAALAASPRRESHRPPLLTPYSCRELTPRRFSRRSTQAIPSTRSSRVILPRPRGRPIPHGLRHTCRPATAAFGDHPRSRCQWRTALVKPRAAHSARRRASTYAHARWKSAPPARSLHGIRTPNRRSPRRPASTNHRLRRELVEVTSALLLRSAGAEGEGVAQVAAGGIFCAGDRGSRIADCVY